MYPAKDLSDHYTSLGYVTAYDNLPDSEVIDFQTVDISPNFYYFGEEGAGAHTAIIQARILRKKHEDLLTIINQLMADLDGKQVLINDNSYEVFTNSVSYQGFRSTSTGMYRYGVVTFRMIY